MKSKLNNIAQDKTQDILKDKAENKTQDKTQNIITVYPKSMWNAHNYYNMAQLDISLFDGPLCYETINPEYAFIDIQIGDKTYSTNNFYKYYGCHAIKIKEYKNYKPSQKWIEYVNDLFAASNELSKDIIKAYLVNDNHKYIEYNKDTECFNEVNKNKSEYFVEFVSKQPIILQYIKVIHKILKNHPNINLNFYVSKFRGNVSKSSVEAVCKLLKLNTIEYNIITTIKF